MDKSSPTFPQIYLIDPDAPKTDKELEALRRKVTRVLKKCDRVNYQFTHIDLGVFARIGEAQTIDDIPGVAIQHFERFCDRLYLTR